MRIDLAVEIENDKAVLVAEALGMQLVDPVSGEPFEGIDEKVEAFLEANLHAETEQKYAAIVQQIWVREVNPTATDAASAQQEKDVKEIMQGMVTMGKKPAASAKKKRRIK